MQSNQLNVHVKVCLKLNDAFFSAKGKSCEDFFYNINALCKILRRKSDFTNIQDFNINCLYYAMPSGFLVEQFSVLLIASFLHEQEFLWHYQTLKI